TLIEYGSHRAQFYNYRGVRQGDPMAGILFVYALTVCSKEFTLIRTFVDLIHQEK
ncbi:Hypothetical protein FKW44_013155, partial [Caligus rogercresseyi]